MGGTSFAVYPGFLSSPHGEFNPHLDYPHGFTRCPHCVVHRRPKWPFANRTCGPNFSSISDSLLEPHLRGFPSALFFCGPRQPIPSGAATDPQGVSETRIPGRNSFRLRLAKTRLTHTPLNGGYP